MYQTLKLSKFSKWLSRFLDNLYYSMSNIWILVPKLVRAIMSKSRKFQIFLIQRSKTCLHTLYLEIEIVLYLVRKLSSKCFLEGFHKFFWWQGFAFTCFLSSTVGLLIVLLLLLPLVVLAPYEKVFFMLFSKKRGGVLSCNFFSTLFYWWLETLHQKTCHPVIISPLNKS